MSVILFIFGLAIGSFLNVVAMRYDPDSFLFGKHVIGGRSHCPSCRRTLRWFELLPLVSFLVQRGRCRICSALLSYQYPLAELITGLIFILVPMALPPLFDPGLDILLSGLWVVVFSVLLLMALIDIRTQIIPDEIVLILAFLGIAIILISTPVFGLASGSFLRDYALIFGLRGNIWLNHLLAAAFGAGFFLLLILITKGRGMGMGDAKLALVLGLVFGWPDIIFLTIFSFLIGSFYGVFQIFRKKEHLKSAIPFGPFLALGATTLFFFGNAILHGYFGLFNL